MRSLLSLKLLVAMTIALIATLSLAQQQTSDSELSDTLSWMDNTYNPHPDVSFSYGHGRAGSYMPKKGSAYNEEVLWSGFIDTFTYNGCQMTLRVEANPASHVWRESHGASYYSFNLRDINPQSIKMNTLSDIGGSVCETFDPEYRANLNCDYGEIVATTRLEAPLVDQSSSETKHTSKGKEVVFLVDDVEYGKRFMKAFRHAVELCGGKPEPF
jgi:hypothetical protein